MRSDINTIIICLTHTSMGKPCSCMQFIKSHIFYYKSRENPYQVLQVMHAASECAMKSKVRMINHYHQSTKLYQKKYHEFVAIAIVSLVTMQMATNS